MSKDIIAGDDEFHKYNKMILEVLRKWERIKSKCLIHILECVYSKPFIPEDFSKVTSVKYADIPNVEFFYLDYREATETLLMKWIFVPKKFGITGNFDNHTSFEVESTVPLDHILNSKE